MIPPQVYGKVGRRLATGGFSPEVDELIAKITAATGTTRDQVVKQSIAAYRALRKLHRKVISGSSLRSSDPAMRTIMHPERSGRISREQAKDAVAAVIRERTRETTSMD